jgi:hypothetical protein
MRTWFYKRSAYDVQNVAVPECFIRLDEFFDTQFATASGLMDQSVTLADNLCCRMASIELFASYISKAYGHPNAFQGAILIGTFLVAYFNACKSLLDAAAITLATAYNLTLTNKQRDFAKSELWKELKTKQPILHGRYSRFKPLFSEIVEWRDSAVHRTNPLVVVHAPDGPDKTPRDKQRIRVVDIPDAVIRTVVEKGKDTPWVEPLHFHRKWQSRLIDLCGEICFDIQHFVWPSSR